MRADGDVDRAVGEAGEDVAAVGARDAVGEQLDAQRPVAEEVGRVGHRDVVQQASDACGVLLGEHLGGRHQRSLVTTLHRGEHRADGNEGLARADVALQQPVHRVRSGEVGLDLADRPLLRVGELVRQRSTQAADELAADRVADALRLALERALAHDEHGLHAQQLVEGETSARHFLLRVGLGEVDADERLVARHHAEAAHHRGRQRVGESARLAAVQRVRHPAGDLPCAERGLLALRIDRHDLAGAVADEVDDGVGELQTAAVHLRLAEQSDLQAFAELPLAPRLVEEHDVHASAAVAHDRFDDAAPVAADSLGDAAHRDEHECFHSRQQIAHPALVGAVDPPAGIRGEQIEHAVHAHLVQRRELLVADALQPFDADLGQLAQADRTRCGIGHRPRLIPRRRGTGRAVARPGAPRPGLPADADRATRGRRRCGSARPRRPR